jgi:hypothetical protein
MEMSHSFTPSSFTYKVGAHSNWLFSRMCGAKARLDAVTQNKFVPHKEMNFITHPIASHHETSNRIKEELPDLG